MRSRLLILLLVVALGLSVAGLAQAELSQEGNVRISFSGDFSPRALPRDRLAPVTVDVAGEIGTTDGSHPPAVSLLEIGLNRNGVISTVGLPACTGPLLQSTSSEVALARCRPALVGRGHFTADVQFPTTAPVSATGTLLAFFGHKGGRPAIFLHLYATTPVQVTFVLPLTISHRARGAFGTVLSAKFPTLAGGLGSVTKIDLRIGREYTYKGQRRGFLSASCAAPSGFPGALFPLVRGTFHFVDGRKIDTTLARACRVR
jgi:hypothetical protein